MLKSKTGKHKIINKKILILILLNNKFIKQNINADQIIFKISTLYSINPRNLLLKL